MAYNSSTKMITAPVSIKDVQQCLGTSDTDLGTLCKKSVINKWAKYKPVGTAKIGTYDDINASDANKTWKATATWWKGNKTATVIPANTDFYPNRTDLATNEKTNQYPAAWIKTCGLKYLGFTNQSDVLRLLNPIRNWTPNAGGVYFSENFTYVPPVGGSTEPFRLIDFNQYHHEAYFRGFTDIDTSRAVILYKGDSTNLQHQNCILYNYDESVDINFSNIFMEINQNAFTVIVGYVDYQNNNNLVTLAGVGLTRSKEGLNLVCDVNLYSAIGNLPDINSVSVIGIYCAVVTISETTYYVPLMQSSGYNENFKFLMQPKTDATKEWSIRKTPSTNPVTIGYKTQYDLSYNNLTSSSSGSFGNCENLYFKLTITNNTTSSMTFTSGGIKVEFAGMFNQSTGGNATDVLYEFKSGDGASTHRTTFALRETEQQKTVWDDQTGGIIVPPNQTKTMYLYMRYVLNDQTDSYGQTTVVTKGGTVKRISLWMKQPYNVPDVIYGQMPSGNMSITISAL